MTVRTLVVHTGGIGDFLLACPAIAQLDSGVELLGRPERLSLAVEAGIAHAAHDIDAVEFHTLLATPSERCAEFVRRFDRAIVWMRDPDGMLARGLRKCGIGHVEVFPGLPDADWSAHASDYYAHCLRVTPDSGFRLEIGADAAGCDVVVHPGSGSRSKNWPLEHFQTLAHRLTADGRKVAWCLGPAEYDRMPEAARLKPILQPQSLLGLARTLADARLYIGNDSGITHLAASVGCATVAVFGPTDPRVWAPRGAHVAVVPGDPWPTVANVLSHC